MKKVLCIYHSVDLDGWMSAAIVKHWFTKTQGRGDLIKAINKDNSFYKFTDNGPTSIDFLGWNYGDPIPDSSEYDKVIMCDVSFSAKEMLKIWAETKLIWVDHHISAITEINKLWDISQIKQLDGLRNTDFAACELTWKYLFPNEPMPEIVRLLGRYDCFGHKGTDEEQKVLEFQYGARSCISGYEEAYRELSDNIYCENTELEIWHKGKAIYQYLCTEAKQEYQKKFTIEFVELKDNNETFIRKFLCVNKGRFNPINFGIDYHKDGYDGAACFWYNGDKWAFSLYNDNGEVDCSVIAKDFGGGGHKGAAGFIADDNKLKLILKA